MLTPFIDTREPVSGSVDGSDGFASLVDWLSEGSGQHLLHLSAERLIPPIGGFSPWSLTPQHPSTPPSSTHS